MRSLPFSVRHSVYEAKRHDDSIVSRAWCQTFSAFMTAGYSRREHLFVLGSHVATQSVPSCNIFEACRILEARRNSAVVPAGLPIAAYILACLGLIDQASSHDGLGWNVRTTFCPEIMAGVPAEDWYSHAQCQRPASGAPTSLPSSSS